MHHNCEILEVHNAENTWFPPSIDAWGMADAIKNDPNVLQSDSFLHIFRMEPYIDSIYIRYDADRVPVEIRRFAIHEGYRWDSEDEEFFHERCIKHGHCGYSGGMIDRIYTYCKASHPEWHVRRYLTKGLRLIDHIYNCVKENTAKEMLYKAGLDELAVHIGDIDELNLLARKPSDFFGGLSMKVLRSLNCREGAALINSTDDQVFIKALNQKFPDVFSEKLNDAQCKYLQILIHGNLTVGETGRLFRSRKPHLREIWHLSMFSLFMAKERYTRQVEELCKEFGHLDPIYERYIKSVADLTNDPTVKLLEYYLVLRREEYNRKIRQSNRKREYDWQERGDKYHVRYPQTIHDFCREAVYMQNYLISYVEALIRNDTTLLFMRKASDANKPFITIEVYQGVLMQAYHRFNRDCSAAEARWIRSYCDRHGIRTERFRFNAAVDELY